ncbi:MAG: hypothetical protein Q9221_000607 [Calogaya cf. arnoldii]
MSTSSPKTPPDPWTVPKSPGSKILCIPSDIPFPPNIQSVLEESRKQSSNPNIMSWKEVVCAGPDDNIPDVENKMKDTSLSPDTATEGESMKRTNDIRPKRPSKSPHGLSPEDAKRLFEILGSTDK